MKIIGRELEVSNFQDLKLNIEKIDSEILSITELKESLASSTLSSFVQFPPCSSSQSFTAAIIMSIDDIPLVFQVK